VTLKEVGLVPFRCVVLWNGCEDSERWRRYIYNSIDCFAENPYKDSAQAERYRSLTSQGIDKRPSEELLQWMMAKILLEHNGKLIGRVKNLMKTAYIMASKSLRDSRSK
jgi:hypothetical protein